MTFKELSIKNFISDLPRIINNNFNVVKTFIEKVFTGPIWKQVEDALDYIKTNIIEEKVVKISGQAAAERFFIPLRLAFLFVSIKSRAVCSLSLLSNSILRFANSLPNFIKSQSFAPLNDFEPLKR